MKGHVTRSPEPRTVVIEERGETRLSLTQSQAAELQSLGFCSVLPGQNAGEWRVRDVSKVGIASIEGLRFIVRPKTPLRSIVFMASYSGEQIQPAHSTFGYDADTSVPFALARATISAIESATRKGLVKGYTAREERGFVVRGRWDIPRQLKVRPGVPIPLELTVDDYSEDVAENQILHSALQRIRRFEQLAEDEKRRLNRLLQLFSDVGTLRQGAALPAVQRTRLNADYWPALPLARVILEATSWTRSAGARSGGTFLLNLPRIFEGFVGTAMRAALASAGFGVELQDTEWRLDAERKVMLRPDIVVRSHGRPVAVADTKYKVWGQANGSPPNADVYQALAYALALEVPEAHLFYVSGDVEPRTYRIPTAGKTVVAHAISLEGSPEVLLRRVAVLAERVTGGSHGVGDSVA
ncbi:McrC family protein [Microbacterium sp. BR1]|uniref:McrC family protein n=1 Tax=Microbacterium sp. BR1 TaxID=1070896 RepID=UPI000C2CD406|nr:hypothetical protein [Microbacterium sp. BR1]